MKSERVCRTLPSPQRHTFRAPPNRKAGFDGIVVRCQVLECEPPSRLAYSWSAGPIIDTQVIYRLEPDGGGTLRANRGNAWDSYGRTCNATARSLSVETYAGSQIGFRLARVAIKSNI